MPTAQEVADFLDTLLSSRGFPDYPGALNGLQLTHRGPVRRIAAAVDFSQRTVDAVVAANANFLILHHGMFWGGTQAIVGAAYERMHRLLSNDVAVYASHLPLDAHPNVGNNALLARALGLTPSGRFGAYQGVDIGVSGEADLRTVDLLTRADVFARALGGAARASLIQDAGMTRRWAIMTGAGASTEALREAELSGIDTLIVGEGPHHTTVGAADAGIAVVFAGHYATETLGVREVARVAGEHFGVSHEFLHLPTGS